MMKIYKKPHVIDIIVISDDDDEPNLETTDRNIRNELLNGAVFQIKQEKDVVENQVTPIECIRHENVATEDPQNDASNHQNTVYNLINSEIHGNLAEKTSKMPKTNALNLIQNYVSSSDSENDSFVVETNAKRSDNAGKLFGNSQNAMFFGENLMQISSDSFVSRQSTSSFPQEFEFFKQSVTGAPFTSQDFSTCHDHNYFGFQNDRYSRRRTGSFVDQHMKPMETETLRSFLDIGPMGDGNDTVQTQSVQADLDPNYDWNNMIPNPEPHAFDVEITTEQEVKCHRYETRSVKPVDYKPFYSSSLQPLNIDKDLLYFTNKRRNRNTNAPNRPKQARGPKPTSPWIQVSPDGQIIPSITQNTNSELYLSNQNSQWCIRCHRRYKRTVSHYKAHHPDKEVFVARLSPNMTAALKNGDGPDPRRVIKRYTKYLEAVCPFCEEEKSFSTQYWIQHIRSHTGEYMNRCVRCSKLVCFNSHCGKATIKPDGGVDLRTNDLKAFMCTDCNFIQTNKENVGTHLKNEHGILNNDLLIHEVCLLPSWNLGEIEAANQAAFAKIPMNIQPVLEVSMDVSMDDDFQFVDNCSVKPIDVAIKLEPNEEQPLLDFVNNSEQIDNTNRFHVRPWINGDSFTKSKLHLTTQFALYKCMHNDCLFSTDEMKKWQKHMEQHVKLMDALQAKNKLTNQNRIEHKKFRECPYCIDVLQSNGQVTLHMEEEHRRCIFQCKHCFYRTIEMDNIVSHYKDFHDGEAQEVLVNDENREFEDKDVDILDEAYQYTDRLKCRDCIDKHFKTFKSFYLHLKAKHRGKFNCANCEFSISGCTAQNMQDHFVDVHEFDEFQCLHCSTGSNDVDEIRKHMSTEHPSKFLIVATRLLAKMVYIGNCLDGTAFTRYQCKDTNILNCLDERLYTNEMNKRHLSLMCNEIQIQKMNHDSVEPINFTKISKQLVQYMDYVRLKQPQKAQERQRLQQPQQLQQLEEPSTSAQIDEWDMIDDTIACNDNLIANETHLYEPVASSRAIAIQAPVDESVDDIKQERFSPVPDPLITVIRYKYINQNVAEDMGLFRKSISKAVTEYGLPKFLQSFQSITSVRFEAQNDLSALKVLLFKRHFAGSPIVYLKIEQTAHYQIERLIRCTFRCNICTTEYLTATLLGNHFFNRHTDCMVDAQIKEEIMVVSSTDPATPAPSYQNDWHGYNLYKLLACPDISHDFTGSRTDAIQHHLNEHGTSAPFRFRITNEITDMRHKEWSQENEKPHRMYVFKCKSCSKYFESIEDASAHCTLPDDANSSYTDQKHQCKLGFEAMKLVACRACKIVSTFEGIQLHECDSSAAKNLIQPLPVNALDRSRCAFCPSSIRDTEYLHYENEHANEYTLSPRLLNVLNLNKSGIDSRYRPGCCSERWYRYSELDKLVQHHYKCSTNFECTDCTDIVNTTTLNTTVSHYRQDHNRNTEEIIEKIQSTKRVFKTTPFQMRVMLPTGLSSSEKSIANTEFSIFKLRPRIIEILKDGVWITEREEIERIVEAINKTSNEVEIAKRRPRALSSVDD